ncbi:MULTISPECIES: SRPBCC family protein [Kitasatospora]|uniref:SRPBCC family protein n=1 Tax=Kitasatospora TaxID=2063 RepID=UPI000C27C080|nr:SRPBCC family protein [Kitasatospora sp. CB02891]PJN26037.1 cyclase [Kitasatospora sp. CB02891]
MTTIRTTHRIEVSAPAAAVYRVVADVTSWPLYFPPTVRAELVSGDDRTQVIRIWALANGELRTWTSARTLDEAALTVEFEQTTPRDPVAAMGGAWRITGRPDGTCTVELDHHYRAVGDTPENRARIASAVDANSTSELAALKAAVERTAEEPELLVAFEDSDTFAGSVEDAYEFVRDLAKWPERIPHVLRMEVREEVPGLQSMEMDTRSPDGSVHTTRSGRVCLAPTLIAYKQTRLPGVLAAHTGEWAFEAAGDGLVTVTSRHRVVIDPGKLASLPQPPGTLADARAAVRAALGANSRATIAVARQYTENLHRDPTTHESEGGTAVSELTFDQLRGFLLRAVGEEDSTDLSADDLDAELSALGFDSLAVIDVTSKLEQHFGIKLPEESTAEATTPRGLLDLVNGVLATSA